MTVRDLLDQLDLRGESREEVYVWDAILDKPIPILLLERVAGKLIIL
jgi:hypothetical protein